MNEPNPGSIGEQIDEFVAHLIERQDRLASDVARDNAKIAALRSRVAGIMAVGAMFLGLVFSALAAHIAGLIQ